MQSSEFFGKYNPLAMQFVPRFSVIPSFFPGSNIIPANIIIPTGFFDMRSLMALAQNNFAKSHMDVPTSLYSHPSMVSDHSSTNYSFSPSVSSPCEEQSVEFNSLTNNTNDETFLKYEESGNNVKIEELVKEEKSSSFIKQSKKIKKQTFTIIRDAQHSKSFCKESVERKRTSWTKEEDTMLLQLYEQYGSKWSRIAAGIKGRTSKQTRERYLHILSPGINHGKWTKEEKELFVVLYKRLGNKWSEIAKSLPGRTEVMIKNRFYAKKRKGQYQDLVVEAGQVSGI